MKALAAEKKIFQFVTFRLGVDILLDIEMLSGASDDDMMGTAVAR